MICPIIFSVFMLSLSIGAIWVIYQLWKKVDDKINEFSDRQIKDNGGKQSSTSRK